LVWRNGNYTGSTANTGFEQLNVPLNSRDKVYNNSSNQYYNLVGWSVEEEWLHQAANYYNDNVYLIKSAFGGLGIRNWSKTNGKMYAELNEMILGAEIKLTKEGLKPRFRGIVWMQGEADLNTTDYYNQLQNLITNIRRISINTQNIPLIIIKIPPNTLYYSSTVDAAFDQIVLDDTAHNFKIIPNTIPNITLKDNIHYDDTSKILLGKEIFDFQLNHHQLN
jgi:hypothetical protein